jgi:tRNA pseudouridine synthase 10
MVWSDLSLRDPEPLKAEMNREVGKAVSELTGKEADFTRPDIVAILDLAAETVEIQVNPVFFAGRYLKYERGIPQTRWDCRACRGVGCERCGFTGKQYADSVEELIGRPVIEAFDARDAILHGAGREDIDARMLGSGRPFVMEVEAPRKRSVDLVALEEEINRKAEGRVAVHLTGWADRKMVQTLKSDKAYKKYRILVEIDGPVTPDEFRAALDQLKGVTIRQRTPIRVSHRRADRVRERQVIDIQCTGRIDGRYRVEVVGEAGLYIKELVSGDGGRTRPSLAQILGRTARVVSLDVVQVKTTNEYGE